MCFFAFSFDTDESSMGSIDKLTVNTRIHGEAILWINQSRRTVSRKRARSVHIIISSTESVFNRVNAKWTVADLHNFIEMNKTMQWWCTHQHTYPNWHVVDSFFFGSRLRCFYLFSPLFCRSESILSILIPHVYVRVVSTDRFSLRPQIDLVCVCVCVCVFLSFWS